MAAASVLGVCVTGAAPSYTYTGTKKPGGKSPRLYLQPGRFKESVTRTAQSGRSAQTADDADTVASHLAKLEAPHCDPAAQHTR